MGIRSSSKIVVKVNRSIEFIPEAEIFREVGWAASSELCWRASALSFGSGRVHV